MKSSIKVRSAAMVASVATTFMVVNLLALNGYPPVAAPAAPETAIEQVAKTVVAGESS